jgi:hypothetical protein
MKVVWFDLKHFRKSYKRNKKTEKDKSSEQKNIEKGPRGANPAQIRSQPRPVKPTETVSLIFLLSR